MASNPIPTGVPVTPPKPEPPKPPVEKCHCGRKIYYHVLVLTTDGKPFTRGLCQECDSARCDAYPFDCPYWRGLLKDKIQENNKLNP